MREREEGGIWKRSRTEEWGKAFLDEKNLFMLKCSQKLGSRRAMI